MSEKQAIIVIPVYTTQLTVSEHAALRQCFDILSSYPKCFVKPESLDITSLVRDYPANHIVPFPDTYFKGIAGYNRLMMSPEFYETFAQWEYILIYQTDAWVFSDRLSEWCSKGYDYIGAPWIPKPKYRKLYYRIFNFLKEFLLHLRFVRLQPHLLPGRKRRAVAAPHATLRSNRSGNDFRNRLLPFPPRNRFLQRRYLLEPRSQSKKRATENSRLERSAPIFVR